MKIGKFSWKITLDEKEYGSEIDINVDLDGKKAPHQVNMVNESINGVAKQIKETVLSVLNKRNGKHNRTRKEKGK